MLLMFHYVFFFKLFFDLSGQIFVEWLFVEVKTPMKLPGNMYYAYNHTHAYLF